MNASLRTFRHLALASALWVIGATADEEPVVNVYNWADYIGPTTIADFEAEYGIKVNYDIYDSTEVVDAKLMAGSTGYDVVIHSAAYSARFFPVGFFMPLDRSRIPNWKYLDPGLMEFLALCNSSSRIS